MCDNERKLEIIDLDCDDDVIIIDNVVKVERQRVKIEQQPVKIEQQPLEISNLSSVVESSIWIKNEDDEKKPKPFIPLGGQRKKIMHYLHQYKNTVVNGPKLVGTSVPEENRFNVVDVGMQLLDVHLDASPLIDDHKIGGNMIF
ncbi:17517_t:CDS:2 [Racocetra persica]|uniref:17517_t:CDS:1 n=1 Tax=Racocetra persica TaxID=160502 RepID=A0ACA9LTU8_9GLOM|nr:17517_t:CDS:2 [Racocetra persica]